MMDSERIASDEVTNEQHLPPRINRTVNIGSSILYIPPEHWSSRFDPSTYFTVQIKSRQVLHQLPVERFVPGISVGRRKFPAIYYAVHVCFGSHERVCLRRYSQFKWLYEELIRNPPEGNSPPRDSTNMWSELNPPDALVEGLLSAEHPPLSMPPARRAGCAGIFLPRGKEEEEDFYDTRQEELQAFCENVLTRPGSTTHDAVVAFFELQLCCQSTQSQNEAQHSLPHGDIRQVLKKKKAFPFDVVVVTSPDVTAAKAALSGSLQDILRFLDEQESMQSSGTKIPWHSPKRHMSPERYSSVDLDGLGRKQIGEENAEEYLISISGIIIVSTTDPLGSRCGSGGGTVSALAHAENVYQKLMGSEKGVSMPSVLIVHAGGDSSRCPTQMTLGKAWTSLPVCRRFGDSRKVEVSSPTQMLMQLLTDFFHKLPRGSVVVGAGDCLVSLGETDCDGNVPHLAEFGEFNGGTVLGLAVPAPLETAKNHGVFVVKDAHKSDEFEIMSSPVSKFLQKPSLEILTQEATVFTNKAWIDTGVVVFLPRAAYTLRLLGGFANEIGSSPQKVPPVLRPCTLKGLESMYDEYVQSEKECVELLDLHAFARRHALPVDLYTHIMKALPTSRDNPSEEKRKKLIYLKDMKSSLQVVKGEDEESILSQLYDVLSNLNFGVCCVSQGQFCHMGTTRELLELECFGVCNALRCDDEQDEKESSFLKETRTKCRDFGDSCSLISRAVCFLSSDVVLADPMSVVVNTIFDTSAVTVTNDTTERMLESVHSKVGANCVLEHCSITTDEKTVLDIKEGCLLSGLRGNFATECSSSQVIEIPEHMVVQQTILKKNWRFMLDHLPQFSGFINVEQLKVDQEEFVFTVLSAKDSIKARDTVYGLKFERFFDMTGLGPEDIWPSEEVLPKDKRNLWNAHIHTVLQNSGDAINVDPVISWISDLMRQSSSGGGFVHSDNAHLHTRVEEWKSMTRLSLQQVRAVSDAFEEHSYRHHLEAKIGDVMSNHFEHCRSVLMNNTDVECDTTPFVASFIGGDSAPMMDFIGVLEDVIKSSIANGTYNVPARCFTVLAGILLDVTDELSGSSSMIASASNAQAKLAEESTLSFERAIEELRPEMRDLDRSEKLASSQRRIAACTKILSLLDVELDEAVNWHPPKPWMVVLNHVDTMKSCAHLLEQASAALTEVCVCSSSVALRSVEAPAPEDCWAVACAPGRIDLAGGWSDTPPVSYENGGAVANIAVTVDGLKPLSARCRRVAREGCLLVTEHRSWKDGTILFKDETRLNVLQDVNDFRNPQSKAALLKAALICLGLVPGISVFEKENLDSPIQPFINSFFGESGSTLGLEVVSTSLLPRGSGMGGSSILAGCVLASICRCAGAKLTIRECGSQENGDESHDLNLLHAVLIVEQLMTTGGGWQDQVGGLLPGFKIGRSLGRRIPLKLDIECLTLSKAVLQDLNDRLILAYTGSPRLAKDLLRNVLRRWAHRTAEIVKTMKDLVDGAEAAVKALIDDEDLDDLGQCMSNYWEQKKIMVGGKAGDENYGGEPPSVRQLLQLLRENNEIAGGTLLGAGGGGFLSLLARRGRKGTDLEAVANELCSGIAREERPVDMDKFTWHKCEVCSEGMQVTLCQEESFSLSWHHPSV